jgi:hypothetical protein
MGTGYRSTRSERPGYTIGLVFAVLLAALMCWPAQAAPQLRTSEVVIKQAAGRVVFCVTKDTILVASVEGGGRPGSRIPAIAPLGMGRVAVVMGAVDWTVGDPRKLSQLDAELPRLVQTATATPSGDPQGEQASDIESIGVTLLEFVRPMVSEIHHKLDLAADEPLIELVLAGYAQDYGPEIWSLRYRVQQRNLGNDYWDTRPLRPAYQQLYPPEKSQPQTFIEAQHPPKLAPLGLLRAAQSDPQLQHIRTSSEEINQAITAILNGESKKAATRPVADFLRAAIPVVAGDQAQLAIGALDERYRFQWLLAPEDPLPAPAEAEPGSRPLPPERPSLRRAAPSSR